MSSDDIIDWQQVAALRDEIGEDGFAEVAELFLAEMDEMLTAIAAQDAPPEAAQYHAIKGSALNLGMIALARQAAEGERAAQAGAGGASAAQLQDSFAEARRVLAATLAKSD